MFLSFFSFCSYVIIFSYSLSRNPSQGYVLQRLRRNKPLYIEHRALGRSLFFSSRRSSAGPTPYLPLSITSIFHHHHLNRPTSSLPNHQLNQPKCQYPPLPSPPPSQTPSHLQPSSPKAPKPTSTKQPTSPPPSPPPSKSDPQNPTVTRFSTVD